VSLYSAGVATVASVAALAAGVAFLLRRLALRAGRAEACVERNEPLGQVFTIVGGLHAVVLAFVLITLFDGASAAADDAAREANALVAVDWAAAALPEPTRSAIHELTTQYMDTVIEREWPRLRAGQPVDGTGRMQLDELRQAIDRADTSNAWQHERRLAAANRLWEAYQARQRRLDASGGGVGLVVWFALVTGSLLAMALPFLFGGTELATHVVMVAVLAATISLLMFAIYQMQNPFSGGASIEPDAFQSARQLVG
jgi:hypothetical protein